MKIALLSNVTVEVLAGMLRKDHTVWLAPGNGAWMEIALDPPDDLRAFAPDAIWLLLDSRNEPIRADPEVARARLSQVFPRTAVCVLDVTRFAADFGDAFYDAKMWQLARMPWSLLGLRELTKLFGWRKVLAVDLDNTIWEGVVGEDGPSGVRLRDDFIARLKDLRDRGVLLVVLSKNNPSDVDWFFGADSPFVARAVDWSAKCDNLARLAAELNLGTDAFVFVDDNPVERAEMRARRPEVLVADYPPQLDAFFPRRNLTAEDRARTDQYHAESLRRAFAVGLSPDDYLAQLEIRTEIHPMLDEEVPRVAQLSQKSNQFNVCTNRYGEDDIRRLAADTRNLILTLHARDRFGDQGLVAFVRAERRGQTSVICDWVMSCRAMNRRLEFALEDELEHQLAGCGQTRLCAAYRPTVKNYPVKDLFEKFGFTLVSETHGCKMYEKALTTSLR